MRINKKLKFVFISTPKACTHTIYNILEKHFSDGLLRAGFHNNQIVNSYQSYFRWTVVRNPFTRAVSIWWSACRLAHLDQYKFRRLSGGQYDFTRFVVWMSGVSEARRNREPLLMNQSDWLAPVEPINALHLENLQEEIKYLSFWKDNIKIQRLNTTDEKIQTQSQLEGEQITKPSIKELYKDPEAVDAVLKWAGNDFSRFGYEKSVP